MITIRPAKQDDNSILTDISFASKRYWKYPDAYFDVWRDELTITPEYINNNIVYIAEAHEEALAYFSLIFLPEDLQTKRVLVKKGWWLEHMFVRPQHIGMGIGTQMMDFAINLCRQKGIEALNVFADPNAKGFYEKMGLNYVGEYPSSIEGRTVCLFELKISSTLSLPY